MILIITDGLIHDEQETKNVIVELSKYPVSIIIVGLGDGDFGNMIELEGDNYPVTNSQGVQVVREIVQFVNYNEEKASGYYKLSEDVLKRIPDEISSYLYYS